jgi:heme exporter protein A
MTEANAIFRGQRLACERGGRVVFTRLDFALAAGEMLVLRGANGSGKSSLLRVMAGLTPLLAGDLRWGEAPVAADRLAHHARFHYVGHQDAVKPALTVRENLQLWERLRNGTEMNAAAALERLGIARLADLPARLLSAGQRRRLALSRLAAIPAPLWLLDEPATALDSDGAARFDDMLQDHLAGGGRAVVSSHGEVSGRGPVLNLGEFRPSPQDSPG